MVSQAGLEHQWSSGTVDRAHPAPPNMEAQPNWRWDLFRKETSVTAL